MGCQGSTLKRKKRERKIVYNISIKTSDAYTRAGTDSTVYLELVGNNCLEKTGYLKLDHFLQDDFERGQVNHFKILAKDIGLPMLIRLKLENFLHKEDHWLCDRIYVSIQNDPTKIKFPVYDWVVDEMEIARGEAILPQKIGLADLRLARRSEIQKNKTIFEWIPCPTMEKIGWGLPRYVNADSYEELPALFKRDAIRDHNFKNEGLAALIDAVIGFLKVKTVDPLNSLSSFMNLFNHKAVPNRIPVDEHWCLDETMGREVLTGISPLMTSRCEEIPHYFLVKNDDVKDLLAEGKCLEEEMKAGKIYLSDYVKIVRGCHRNKNFHCPDCIGLFYVNEDREFVPIAIQLVPDDRQYLFTPNDSHDDWLLAKMYFRCTTTNVHEWIFHFLYTHNIMEPFSVAFFRCFPRSHPIYKLMRPHLQTIAAINTDARKSLIPDDSAANQALSLSALKTSRTFFKVFTFEDLIIPKRLKKQGTDDPKLLPHYYYRDDALALWQAMEHYVSGVIRYYYKNDNDVQEDYELQDFAQDVAQEGLGWQDGNTRGMPDEITSIEQLIEICVTLMFTSSAQHAAVNFGQFDTYKFIPNSPACMRLPPHKKGEADLKRILKSLPSAEQSVKIIAIAHALSSFSPNEVFLGEYPVQLFIEEPILSMQQEYRNQLLEITATINERNKDLEHKYDFLLPSRVPNSIAI